MAAMRNGLGGAKREGVAMAASEDTERKRLEHLRELRAGVFEEMEEADAELSRLRMRVERLESDLRLGAEPTEEYTRIKGHQMPEVESRIVQAYRNLLKIEDKIRQMR
jgi:hypothetical protein